MNKNYGTKDNSNLEKLKRLDDKTKILSTSIEINVKGTEEVRKQLSLVTDSVKELNKELRETKILIESVKLYGKA